MQLQKEQQRTQTLLADAIFCRPNHHWNPQSKPKKNVISKLCSLDQPNELKLL